MVLYGNDPSAGFELWNHVGTQVSGTHTVRITINGFNRYMGSKSFRGLAWKESVTGSLPRSLGVAVRSTPTAVVKVLEHRYVTTRKVHRYMG